MVTKQRRFSQVIASVSLVLAVTLGSAPSADALSLFGFFGGNSDGQRREGTGMRMCNADERYYVENIQNDMADASSSGSSGGDDGAPDGESGGDWLKKGTKANKYAQEIYDFWTKEIGTSGAFAAGVLGNVYQESMGTFDPLIIQGGSYFPHPKARVAPQGGPAGGAYQFDPYEKYVKSPHFEAMGGWTIRGESRYVWDSEVGTGALNIYMKNAPSSYGVESPFTRTYTAVPDRNGGVAHVALDKNALVTTDDPVAASKAFQVGYERPAQYHPEREKHAVAANKVFNKKNFKGDSEKLKKALPDTAAMQGLGNALDTIVKFATGALDPNDSKFQEDAMFGSPCRMPDGNIMTNIDDAKDYAAGLCGRPNQGVGSEYTADGTSGGGNTDAGPGKKFGDDQVLEGAEHMKPATVKMAKAIFKEFPEIKRIGGWRAVDSFPDHPSGRALDVMMPHGADPRDKKLGDAVEKFAWDNMKKYKVTYTIWRQRYVNPTTSNMMEDRGGPTANHFDHVHITIDMYGSQTGVEPPEGESRSEGVGGDGDSGSGSDKPKRGALGTLEGDGYGLDMKCGAGADDSSGESEGDIPAEDGDVIIPTSGQITELFGSRSDRNHSGIDIANEMGTPIYAAQSGKVINAGPAGGYGLWIRIQSKDGTITEYGHQQKNLVKEGDKVKVGQHIADMGSRGFSTGPHLHLTVWSNDKQIDPIAWLQKNGAKCIPQEYGAQVKAGKCKGGGSSKDKSAKKKGDD